jgi:cytochrome c oxidase subunit 2
MTATTPETAHSGVVAPQGVWWKPAHKAEKTWVAIAFAWCMILFAMMPLWHLKGQQNPSGVRGRADPGRFYGRVQEFIAAYQVGWDTAKGGGESVETLPVVEPPPGADVYMIGRMWRWEPVLRLRQGVQYTLHLSALDVNHGFSLVHAAGASQNFNIQVLPGYDYGLRITPTAPGEYRVVCNEFCGIGHHAMVGRIVVVAPDAPALPRLNAAPTAPTDSPPGGER